MDPEEFELLEYLYDAEIYHVDRQIARIIEAIDRAGDRENTVVLVLGDHGENIGDHGLMAHHYSVHETLAHVPLIVRYPGVFEGGEVVEGRVSSLDVPATLAELLADRGITDEQFRAQQDGIPLHEDREVDREVVIEYLNPMPPIERLRAKSENPDFDVTKYDRRLRAIYGDEFKFVRGSDGHRALYALDDGDETDNLVETRPDETEELARQLDQWVAERDGESPTAAATPDEEIETRLQDLGYL
jgi:arylsulfatase A-like enzyme